jgi:hypothetical protein
VSGAPPTKTLRAVIIVGCVLGVIATACQWIAGIDDRTVYDGGSITNDAGMNPCLGANLPPNPGTAGTGTLTFTAALSQIMLGQTDGGPYYGFNLDRTCTCFLDASDSCTRPNGEPRACDDPNGIDNYARRIFETINALPTGEDGGFITEAKLNVALQTGLSGALIQVSQYNGLPNDGEVTVTVFGSVGYANYPTAPAFDGGDKWNIDPTSASLKYQTNNAYVANNTLVASLDFPIIIGSAVTQPVYIQLHSGLIVANLETNDAGVVTKMTGQLGGRWSPQDFLPSLQVVPDPISPGSYLCGSDGTYQILKNIICTNLDVNEDPANDGTGACNAVSMGLGFVALPAQVGATVTPPDAGYGCEAGLMESCP